MYRHVAVTVQMAGYAKGNDSADGALDQLSWEIHTKIQPSLSCDGDGLEQDTDPAKAKKDTC